MDKPLPRKPDPIAKALVPVTDPSWRRWLERLLREGEGAVAPKPTTVKKVKRKGVRS